MEDGDPSEIEVSERQIRVAVVDDHPLVAEAIRRAGGSEPTIDVVATALDRRAGLALAMRDDLDVLVCDLQLGDDMGAGVGAEGFEVLDTARQRGLPVLVLSAFGRAAFARAAFERGAAGFMTKSSDLADVVDAIRRIAVGQTAFSATTLDQIRRVAVRPTIRELEIIRGVAAGRTSEEIAGVLGVSTRTVESHLRRLFDRFDLVSRAELAVLAEREGWLAVPVE